MKRLDVKFKIKIITRCSKKFAEDPEYRESKRARTKLAQENLKQTQKNIVSI